MNAQRAMRSSPFEMASEMMASAMAMTPSLIGANQRAPRPRTIANAARIVAAAEIPVSRVGWSRRGESPNRLAQGALCLDQEIQKRDQVGLLAPFFAID